MAMVTAPGKIELIERQLPEFYQSDVIVRVKACAICGSDLHIYKGKHPSAPLPVAIGHEISGEIILVGNDVTELKIGDRVTIEPVISCDKCYFCQRGQYHLCSKISFQYRKGQGGFTPYFVVNERWAHKLPDHIPYEEGAMVEPLAVAIHAIRRAELELGMTTAIFGDGAIGLLVLTLAKRISAGKAIMVGLQEHRLRMAKFLGADQIINNATEDPVEKIFSATNGLGADRSFEAVGIETTLIQSLQSLKKGGITVLLGIFESSQISIPANLFIQKEITLSGSQGYNWDFQRAINIISKEDLKLDKLITHTLPFDSLQEGFDLLLNEENHAIKVVITFV